MTTRRTFCRDVLGAGAALMLPGTASCGPSAPEKGAVGARLRARPATPSMTITTGLTTLQDGGVRYGLLQVPASYLPATPLPLVLALHGAGRSANESINLLGRRAEAHGFLVLAIDSRNSTWDVIRGAYGPDIAAIDRWLSWVFARCAVQPDRIAIEGFSDGASYALGLGLTNGDLFRRIVSFSPGFVPPVEPHGTPLVFESHGTEDTILGIDQTSRRIVPDLRARGLTVDYHEFAGGHTVPADIADLAVNWLLAP